MQKKVESSDQNKNDHHHIIQKQEVHEQKYKLKGNRKEMRAKKGRDFFTLLSLCSIQYLKLQKLCWLEWRHAASVVSIQA